MTPVIHNTHTYCLTMSAKDARHFNTCYEIFALHDICESEGITISITISAVSLLAKPFHTVAAPFMESFYKWELRHDGWNLGIIPSEITPRPANSRAHSCHTSLCLVHGVHLLRPLDWIIGAAFPTWWLLFAQLGDGYRYQVTCLGGGMVLHVPAYSVRKLSSRFPFLHSLYLVTTAAEWFK